MSRFFELNKELSEFNAQNAVHFFKALLCQEAQRVGIPVISVNCPSDITTADGGIDACGKNPDRKTSDLFISEDVRFQIKADSKKPWNESTIVGELFKDKCTITKFKKFKTKAKKSEQLKPAIKKCLEDGATYVYVSFQHSFVEENHIATKAFLQKYFTECGFPDAKLDVWGYEQLNQTIQKNFPAIVLNLKTKNTNIPCFLYETFSRDSQYRNDYYPDEERGKIINSLRSLLEPPNNSDNAVHIRVLGASGIGKTKTVLEALNINEFKNNCLIFKSPEDFNDARFCSYLNNDSSLIIVIDECNKRFTEEIFNNIEYNYPNIKLITIYNAHEKDTSRVSDENCFVVKELDEDTLFKAIQQIYPTLPEHNIKQIIRLCEGFPRIAIKVSENLKASPENPEKYLDNLDYYWLKYISDKNTIDSSETQEKIKLLEYFSLFERFGYKGSYKYEFDFIISKLKERNNISDDDISRHIDELKSRNVLRGNSVLYISPRIFHNWLKRQWWKKNEPHFNHEEFTAAIPPTLLNLFHTELYEIDIELKKNLINLKFNSINHIENQNVLFGSLLYKCENEAFTKLENIINETSDADLETPRTNIKNILMYFAKNEKYFERSCDLLFRIACFERKTWYSNNTKSDFATLFDIFYNHGDMTTTYTPLEQKSLYLQDLLNNKSSEKELEIILNALAQGIKNPIFISKSKGNGRTITITKLTEQVKFTDIEYKYISEILDLTFKIIEKTKASELITKCYNILIHSPFYLIKDNKTFDFALNHYEKLLNTPKINKLELIKDFEFAFKFNHFQSLNSKNISKINALYENLKKEINFDDLKIFCMNNSYLEEEQESYFKELLKKGALEEKDNLDFLFSKDSKLSYRVGYEVAQIDENWIYFNKIRSKYEELDNPTNIEIILGYFRGAYKVNSVETENKIIEINEEVSLFKILPMIVSTVATDKTVKYLFEYIKNKTFNLSDFRIGYSECSKKLLTEIIRYLLAERNNDSYSIELIMELLNINEKRIDFDESIVLQSLDKSIEHVFAKYNPDSYSWHKLASKYINKNSTKELVLNMFDKIIKVAEDSHDSYTKSILCDIAKIHSKEAWDILSQILEFDHRHIINLTYFLNEFWLNNGLLSIFNYEWIYKWIEENIDTRLYIIAKLAPEHFLPYKDKPDSAFYRGLLIKYPDNRDLSETLSNQSFSGMYEGKESYNCKSKIETINTLLKNETEKSVKKWLKKELDHTERRLKRALEQEERFYEG